MKPTDPENKKPPFIKRHPKLLFCLFILLQLLFTLTFLPDRMKPQDLSFDQEQLVAESGGKPSDQPASYIHSSVSTHAVTTRYFALSRGIYDISVDYTTDNSYRECYFELTADALSSDRGNAGIISCDRIYPDAAESTVSFRTYVNHPSEQLHVHACLSEDPGNSYAIVSAIRIHKLPLKSVLHDLTIYFFFFAVIDLFLILFLFFRERSFRWFRRNGVSLCALMGIVLVGCFPLLHKGVLFGDDILYHLQRIIGISEGLSGGSFPVRIQPGWHADYGYAVGVGYGDLFLFPSGLLLLLGFSPAFALEFYIFFMSTLTALFSLYAFYRITGSGNIALCGTFLYTTMGFRLHSIYAGETVGEYGAYTFLPLIVLGLWEIYRAREEVTARHGIMILSAGLFFTIETHMLSTLILGILIPLFCLLMGKRTFEKRVLLSLLKTVGLTGLLSCSFLIPLIDYLLHMPMRGSGKSWLWDNALDPLRLFITSTDLDHVTAGWSGVGIVALLILFLTAAILVAGCFTTISGSVAKILGMAVFLLFLSTTAFPWEQMATHLPKLYGFLSNLQFPWHFLNEASVLIVLLEVLSMRALLDYGAKKLGLNASLVLLIAETILCMLNFIQCNQFYENMANEARTITAYDCLHTYFGGAAEFTPANADYNDDSGLLSFVDGARGEINSRRGTTIRATITGTESGTTVIFPEWWYPGYQAITDKGILHTKASPSAKIQVSVPPGFHGEIKVCFMEPWYWRVSELVTLLTILYVGIGYYQYVTAGFRKPRIPKIKESLPS